jgi:hypothetical protein
MNHTFEINHEHPRFCTYEAAMEWLLEAQPPEDA